MVKNMKERQKLDWRDTYTPTDAPQVRGNCDHALNREETLSVHGLKTPSNNPNVDLQSCMAGQDLRVPVINMRNEPLMPTTPGKARKLLKGKKAKVAFSNPFTIQLLYATFAFFSFNNFRAFPGVVGIKGSLRMFMTGTLRSCPAMPDCRSTLGLLEGVFKPCTLRVSSLFNA